MKTLNDLSKQQTGIVCSIDGEGQIQCRIQEMGCLPGTEIKVLGKLAAGGAIIAEVRDSKLAIRAEDASFIRVR